MTFAPRPQVATVLERIRGHACAYTFDPARPARFCDCKYGGTNVMAKSETGSGCPELRCAIAVLEAMTEAMTEAEWSRILKRISKRQAAMVRRSEKKARQR